METSKTATSAVIYLEDDLFAAAAARQIAAAEGAASVAVSSAVAYPENPLVRIARERWEALHGSVVPARGAQGAEEALLRSDVVVLVESRWHDGRLAAPLASFLREHDLASKRLETCDARAWWRRTRVSYESYLESLECAECSEGAALLAAS